MKQTRKEVDQKLQILEEAGWVWDKAKEGFVKTMEKNGYHVQTVIFYTTITNTVFHDMDSFSYFVHSYDLTMMQELNRNITKGDTSE